MWFPAQRVDATAGLTRRFLGDGTNQFSRIKAGPSCKEDGTRRVPNPHTACAVYDL